MINLEIDYIMIDIRSHLLVSYDKIPPQLKMIYETKHSSVAISLLLANGCDGTQQYPSQSQLVAMITSGVPYVGECRSAITSLIELRFTENNLSSQSTLS